MTLDIEKSNLYFVGLTIVMFLCFAFKKCLSKVLLTILGALGE